MGRRLSVEYASTYGGQLYLYVWKNGVNTSRTMLGCSALSARCHRSERSASVVVLIVVRQDKCALDVHSVCMLGGVV